MKACGYFETVAIFLCRLALGAYFACAGYGKLFDMGMDMWMNKIYPGAVPPWLPRWFATPYGHAVPYAELILGIMLVVGLLSRVTAALIFLMLLSFTIVLIANSGKLNGGGMGYMHTNLVLTPLALWLAVAGPGSLSIDRLWGKKFKATVEVK